MHALPTAHDGDLLRWPLVGRVLRWRHLRTAMQGVLAAVALVIVLHGLLGPQLASRNVATVLTWVHYRGLLIGVLLLAGNLFCAACPLVLTRDLARRVRQPTRHWPRWLAGKWLAIALMAGVLFAYELFDLWALPAATAWLVLGYFGAAVLVDSVFRGAAFCSYVCPVGQFNFVASTLAPLEIRARDATRCTTCQTADCIRGRRDPEVPALVRQRGCELGLFVPAKVGNLDCTFCLDCVNACPHDNVALGTRVPGAELSDDRRRSVIGRLSARPDIAALVLLFTFGALLNAFAMTGPVYAVEEWLARRMPGAPEAVLLGILFVAGLVVVPVVLVILAAMWTVRATDADDGQPRGVIEVVTAFAFGLVPLGCGIWLAHYGFHFLTGVGTVVPVVQSAMVDAFGVAVLGDPDWRWLGMRPGLVYPLQLGAIVLGTFGSVVTMRVIATRDYADRAGRASASWVLLVVALAACAAWVLAQPMDMRGTGWAG